MHWQHKQDQARNQAALTWWSSLPGWRCKPPVAPAAWLGSSVCPGLARGLGPPPVLTPRHPRLPRPTEGRQMILGHGRHGRDPLNGAARAAGTLLVTGCRHPASHMDGPAAARPQVQRRPRHPTKYDGSCLVPGWWQARQCGKALLGALMPSSPAWSRACHHSGTKQEPLPIAKKCAVSFVERAHSVKEPRKQALTSANRPSQCLTRVHRISITD